VRAVDTNVLVYATMVSTDHHERAVEVLRGLGEGAEPWAIPWPCVYEFLRIVTHPRVFLPPMPAERALEALEAVLRSPSLALLSETERHAEVMAAVLRQSRAAGNLMHDAHIAALCVEHGVEELVTGDRDFSRFPGLRVVNPFEP